MFTKYIVSGALENVRLFISVCFLPFFFISFTFSFVVSVRRDVRILVNLRTRFGKVTDSYFPIKTEQEH